MYTKADLSSYRDVTVFHEIITHKYQREILLIDNEHNILSQFLDLFCVKFYFYISQTF